MSNKEIQRLEFWIKFSPAKNMYGKDADKIFALYSERGIVPKLEDLQNPIRYKQLVEAKKWQGITMQMWEDGVLEGSVPYWTLLGGESPKDILPRDIVNFMKKEMFKGTDAELIERVYQEVFKKWNWINRIKYYIYWNFIFKLKLCLK